MPRVCVTENKYLKGWQGPQHDSRPQMTVCELEAALRATYITDAHMTTYAPLAASQCHRVKREALAAYTTPLFVSTFMIDWDTPGHAAWAHPDEAAELLAKWAGMPIFSMAGFYTSMRGARVVQPLATPIPLDEARPYLHRWLEEARSHGIEWDQQCKSPFGLWRLPHVRRRDGQGRLVQYVPLLDLDRMRPVDLEPLSTRELAAVPATLARPRPRTPLPERQLDDVGEPWRWRVPVIARACLQVRENWHLLFMQLAGALLDKGAPTSRLAAICIAISHETRADTRLDDRRSSAQTTLHQHCNGHSYAGYKSLVRDFRPVALALDEALTIRTADDYVQWKEKQQAPPLATADEAGARVGEILRTLVAGLTLIVAGTGIGKTFQSIQVASERAKTPYKSPDAKGLRAPPHSRTVLLVDKHSVGKDAQDLAAKLGTPACRLYGPLSARDENGNPECIHHEVAQYVVAGGQPMQWVLCEGGGLRRCSKYDTCKARLGAEGPEDARIIIAPHAMANKVPKTSLVVIDERPPLLVTETFTDADIEATIASLPDFAWRYVAALRPAVDAFRAFLRTEKEGSAHRSPVEVATLHVKAVGASDLQFARVQTGVEDDDIGAFAKAVSVDDDGKRCEVPPLRDHAIYTLRGSVATARRIGVASRLLTTLLRVLASPENVAVRVDLTDDGKRSLKVTFPNEPLLRLLREANAVVVMDANAATDEPMYREAVGYAPPVHVLEARDACEVERTQIRAAALNRTSLFPNGTLEITDALVRGVEEIVDWASERPDTTSLGIITMQHVEVALRASWKPTDATLVKEAERLGMPRSVLDEARARLGPLLQRWKGTLEFAHYGDVRGRNDLQHLDALATLTDPRPNLLDVALEAAFGKADISVNALANMRCANELEQAHGRLRTVRRTKPCRVLHVGKVRPSGKAWERGVVERDLAAGRPARSGEMDRFELIEHVARLGGLRSAAAKAGCSSGLLSMCSNGKRGITPELASKLRTT